MKTHSSHRFTITIMAVLLPFLVGGCGNGGGNSTSSTPVATTSASSQAVVELFVSSEFLVDGDELAQPITLVTTITIRESAGLGFAMNWLKVTYGLPGGSDTRVYEYGASTFNNSLGTNRLEAMQQLQIVITEQENLPIATQAELDYTDDRGNQATVTANP